MSMFGRREHEMPGLNTSSLPDLISTAGLCFNSCFFPFTDGKVVVQQSEGGASVLSTRTGIKTSVATMKPEYSVPAMVSVLSRRPD